VQTGRRYLYTPKRIVCLISRPQWALNDPAAAVVVVRSLPRLMTALCSAAAPYFSARSVRAVHTTRHIRVRRPPTTPSAPARRHCIQWFFAPLSNVTIYILYYDILLYSRVVTDVVVVVNRPVNVTSCRAV